MAILSREQAKTLKFPLNKWILHKMLFNKDSWELHEAIEYVKTYLPGQNVPTYIGASSCEFDFLICVQVSGAQFKSQKLKNDIELVFQWCGV